MDYICVPRLVFLLVILVVFLAGIGVIPLILVLTGDRHTRG